VRQRTFGEPESGLRGAMNYTNEKEFLLDAIAFQDGSLEPSRVPGFEDALRSSAEFRAAFIRMELRGFQYVEIQRARTLQPRPVQECSVSATRSIKYLSRSLWSTLAVACIGLLAVLAWPRSDGQGDSIEITHNREAVWGGGSKEPGNQLDLGIPYTLRAGAIRIRMTEGAIVSIAAPASFKVVSGDRIELFEGKIAARLPNEQSRLTVLTDGMTITDLGTAFGVSARPGGESSISVFEGKVLLETVEASHSPAMTLSAGGSVVADGFAPVPIDQEMFDATHYLDIWPLTAGIDEASSLVEFVLPGPIPNLEELRNDNKLFLLPEKLDFMIFEPIEVDYVPNSRSWPDNVSQSHYLPGGSRLRSYLLFFSPESLAPDRFHRLRGSVTFSRPVLGIILESAKLNATDSLLGVNGLQYKPRAARGLEHGAGQQNLLPPDSIYFSKDGRELFFDLNVGRSVDNFRVLVSAD
jgi:ferric-dicitrate binding protein FerR (iron transport regulator)